MCDTIAKVEIESEGEKLTCLISQAAEWAFHKKNNKKKNFISRKKFFFLN